VNRVDKDFDVIGVNTWRNAMTQIEDMTWTGSEIFQYIAHG
jgi:hypothetical protein